MLCRSIRNFYGDDADMGSGESLSDKRKKQEADSAAQSLTSELDKVGKE